MKYLVIAKHGGKPIPSEAGSIGGGIAITLFGCVWTFMAFTITSFIPIPILHFIFPLFGMIFVIGGIASSISSYNNAGNDRRAQHRYHQRRSEIQSRTK